MTGGGTPQVLLVGARRERQGLGPHLARYLERHGARVAAIVGTRPDTVSVALAGLRSIGIESRGFVDLADALAAVRVDAVVIASPARTHAAFLRPALAAGLHVLCEKPLLWGGDDGAAEAVELVGAFADSGLLLFENCQWPYTLDAFEVLHPGTLGTRCERFEMWLSPTSRGPHMLVDALSHPLSLLQTLVPGDEPTVEGMAFSPVEGGGVKLDVAFGYVSGAERTEVAVRLATRPEQPRPAGYAVNGRRAEREVRLEDYALTFVDGGRSVDVPDPMERLVADFVAALRDGTPPRCAAVREGLGARQRLLETLVAGIAGA